MLNGARQPGFVAFRANFDDNEFQGVAATAKGA